jgi:putative DNA primase/helicase
MSDRETLARRLTEAGLIDQRLIPVEDGSKASKLSHNDASNRESSFASLSGNYGVYAGANPSGDRWLIDVDIDDYSDSADSDALEAVNDLFDTLTVKSPHTDGDTGGHRYYYIDGKDVHKSIEAVAGAMNPGPSWGEIRVHNQYVVGPGSQLDGCDKEWCDNCSKPDGGYYEIATDAPIAEITLADLFEVIRADESGEDTPHTAGSVDTSGGTPDTDGDTTHAKRVAEHYQNIKDYLLYGSDDRSETDFHVCCRMIEHGVSESEAYRLLASNPRSKVDHNDASDNYWKRTWQKAKRKVGNDANTETLPQQARADGGTKAVNPGVEADKPGNNTDSGVSLTPAGVIAWAGLGEDKSVDDLNDRQKAACVWALLTRSDEYHIRVRRDNESLWTYDSGIWKPEGERTLRHVARQALDPMNYGQNVLSELKAQARSDETREIAGEEFGLSSGLVAVENGVINLERATKGTSENARRPLEPEDYALTRLPVKYDPSAEYDEWVEYVEEWAETDRADALQEYIGYCLHIGEMPVHRALLLVGSGANGKSTFLSVVRKLLGRENTSSIELQTLANEKDAVADFYGSIANFDDDLSARKLGKGLGMFKKLIAGNHVRARKLYEDGFEFQATGKHLYAANEVPDVDVPDDDEAFWRRWLLIEFPNHYPPSERDPTLESQFTTPEALAGVLNWAIDGWARLLDQGHFTNENQYTHAKRERWQAWGESVDKFLSECVEHDPEADNKSTGDVHRRYAAWCRENNHDPVGQRKLTNKLKKENVGYGKSVRINQTDIRNGYKELSLSGDVPDADETPERTTPEATEQTSIVD